MSSFKFFHSCIVSSSEHIKITSQDAWIKNMEQHCVLFITECLFGKGKRENCLFKASLVLLSVSESFWVSAKAHEFFDSLSLVPASKLSNSSIAPETSSWYFKGLYWVLTFFLYDTRDKELPCQCRKHKIHGFSPWVGQEDPLKEGMATHSSIPAWRIHMDRGAWRAMGFLGSQRVRHQWSDLACKHALDAGWRTSEGAFSPAGRVLRKELLQKELNALSLEVAPMTCYGDRFLNLI